MDLTWKRRVQSYKVLLVQRLKVVDWKVVRFGEQWEGTIHSTILYIREKTTKDDSFDRNWIFLFLSLDSIFMIIKIRSNRKWTKGYRRANCFLFSYIFCFFIYHLANNQWSIATINKAGINFMTYIIRYTVSFISATIVSMLVQKQTLFAVRVATFILTGKKLHKRLSSITPPGAVPR